MTAGAFWAALTAALALVALARGLWLALAVRRATRPAPARRPPAGAANYLLAEPALARARRETLRCELDAVMTLCGAAADAPPAQARALRLSDETLTALVYVVIADPRVATVVLRDTPAAQRIVAGVRQVRDLA